MASVVVQPGQTLEDIAVQHCGDDQAVFDIASLNELNVTDDLTPGASILIPDVFDARTVKVLREGAYVPAVNDSNDPQGIEFWIIEQNFIVQ